MIYMLAGLNCETGIESSGMTRSKKKELCPFLRKIIAATKLECSKTIKFKKIHHCSAVYTQKRI